MPLSSTSQRILVVGAGPSGLCALKELREVGLNAMAVDARDEIGGVFSPNSKVTYENLHLTTSNMFIAFSDFPPRDMTMKYWSKAEYFDYLQQYSQHFQLLPHIQLGTFVREAKMTMDNKWEVTLSAAGSSKDDLNMTSKVETFDYLVIATGANQKPKVPQEVFDGFQGEIIHSSEYHSADQVKGKKVLVVGMGESATDVANGAAKKASSVTVWGRRYPDFAPRFPTDLLYDPHMDEAAHLRCQSNVKPGDFLESFVISRIARNMPLGIWSTALHAMMNDVQSQYGSTSAQSVVADLDIARWKLDWFSSDTAGTPTKTAILGVAAAKGEIDLVIAPKITSNGGEITFHDISYYGASFTNENQSKEISIGVDVVVSCTGYSQDLGWLKTPAGDMLLVSSNPRTWFKHCFPPGLGDHIAFLGYARPHSGGIPQCSEILARYIAQLRIGALQLPKDYAEIAKRDGACEEECFHLESHSYILVDYYAFMMSVARLIGCTPKMPWEPMKIVKHWTFPLWSCFFRTQGPGANQQACDEVLEKFGPYDALTPTPLLTIQVVSTFVTPFLNTLSYIFSRLLDFGKTKILPRAYKWRMSKNFFMYSELHLVGREDFKIFVGQFIAGSILVFHMLKSVVMARTSKQLSA